MQWLLFIHLCLIIIILRRLFVMDSFNVGKLPDEEDTSSSPSSSSSDDDMIVAMGAYLQYHELVQQ